MPHSVTCCPAANRSRRRQGVSMAYPVDLPHDEGLAQLFADAIGCDKRRARALVYQFRRVMQYAALQKTSDYDCAQDAVSEAFEQTLEKQDVFLKGHWHSK